MKLPIIVLEIGINHNGRTQLARKIMEAMNDVVTRSGYPKELIYFKFQKRNPDLAVPDYMKDVPRMSPKTEKMTTYLEYKHEIEFGQAEYDFINALSTELGIRWFASAWDTDSIDFLSKLYPSNCFLKLPSSAIRDIDLIKYAGEKTYANQQHLILSTGGSTHKEVNTARIIAEHMANKKPYLLSCTSTYPTPDEEVNLNKINTLALTVNNMHIGFSSHSKSPYPAIYSNFYGVKMIEVHVTIDRALKGSDHAASLEPNGVELLLRETLRIPTLMGTGEIRPYPSELKKLKTLRTNNED